MFTSLKELKVWTFFYPLLSLMTDALESILTVDTLQGWGDLLIPVRDRLVSTFWTLSSSAPIFVWGFRMWAGAVMVRFSLRFLYIFVKILLSRTTMVLSLGTGTARARVKKESWRATVPVRDTTLTALHFAELSLYVIETCGLMSMGLGLLHAAFFGPQETVWSWFITSLVRSVTRLRVIRLMFDYPFEVFVVVPLLYAYARYRSISTYSKSKVTVTQVVNNYYNGKKEKRVYDTDLALVGHCVVEATGLPWLAQFFLSWRQSVRHLGLSVATRTHAAPFIEAFRDRRPWSVILDNAVIVATYPLSVAATAIAGARRPQFVASFVPESLGSPPPLAPPVSSVHPSPIVNAVLPVIEVVEGVLGDIHPPPRPRNALVEVFKFDYSVPLELFAQGQTMLIGGRDLPELFVINDPRFHVRIPMKPVTNNTFALDLLDAMGPNVAWFRAEMLKLTKVPPNPFRNAVELQKFVPRVEIDIDLNCATRHSNMTEGEFLQAGLDLILGLRSTEKVLIKGPDLDWLPEDHLSSQSRKSHPGLSTRAHGFQTRGDAWGYSLPRAKAMWAAMMGGGRECLSAHIWLFLGVVKKQATRKPHDEEMRSRGAVIPEQELQLCWDAATRPLKKYVESKHVTWCPEFELFHGKMERVWRRFHTLGKYSFSNEDGTDHGATIQWFVAKIMVLWAQRHTHSTFGDIAPVYEALWWEIIHSKIGVPDMTGLVHVFATLSGMNDGVWGTSFWGGVAKCIGELHKIWRFWHTDDKVRSSYIDILDLVRSLRAEIHGDNSLIAYPEPLLPLAGSTPAGAKWLREIGFLIKPDESLLCEDLGRAFVMSWHMSNVGSDAKPRIVGWKPAQDLLKAFFLPERLTDYDSLGIATREYLGEILVSLYILGYWNLASRRWIEVVWRILWCHEPEVVVRLQHIRDFVYKTGLDPERIDPVSSKSLYPYPPTAVCVLWLGPGSEQFVDRYAREAGGEAEAAALCGGLNALRESHVLTPIHEAEQTWSPACVDEY